ncbi:UNKNOWN [Stylonychia lemnae]|uniref:Uncharacterized protein n=1 Tax=Stylonychia lemnae TaxID=5949 RepID=A0A078AJI1_STYLE|nr:UNKNOWN [Stylonychia lemnae]|eukprot:CDW80943.1 UNKNOWN [Stylonychia lemnae]
MGETDYRFFQDCIDVIQLERKDKTTTTGQNKVNETLCKLVKSHTDVFNLLFLHKPIEICQRISLLTLQKSIKFKGSSTFITTDLKSPSPARVPQIVLKKDDRGRFKSQRGKSLHDKFNFNHVVEQKIIKYSSFNNYDLLRKMKQTDNLYLNQIYNQLIRKEKELLSGLIYSDEQLTSIQNSQLEPGFTINQSALFQDFMPYLREFMIRAVEGEAIFARLHRSDLEHALREKDHSKQEQLSDFINELQPFQSWTRNRNQNIVSKKKLPQAFRLLQKGHFFNEENLILQCQQLDNFNQYPKSKKDSKEHLTTKYQIQCKSIEGEFLTINIQDLIKSLLKEDDLERVLERQFKIKTNWHDDEDQMLETFDDEDKKEKFQPLNTKASDNVMQVFRKQQIEFKPFSTTDNYCKNQKSTDEQFQDEAAFRSLLLNKREADYRETLKEVINQYPIVDLHKKVLLMTQENIVSQQSSPVRMNKRNLYINSKIDNEIESHLNIKSQKEQVFQKQSVIGGVLSPQNMFKQRHQSKDQSTESQSKNFLYQNGSQLMSIAQTINRSKSPQKSVISQSKDVLNQFNASPNFRLPIAAKRGSLQIKQQSYISYNHNNNMIPNRILMNQSIMMSQNPNHSQLYSPNSSQTHSSQINYQNQNLKNIIARDVMKQNGLRNNKFSNMSLGSCLNNAYINSNFKDQFQIAPFAEKSFIGRNNTKNYTQIDIQNARR